MSTELEALVRQHQAAVCATAYAVLRDRARSEDVAQDAFLVAWQKLPEISPPPPLPAWICGIARNLARNAARKHRELPMTETTPEVAATNTPLEAALAREHATLAGSALATLSAEDRELVVLYYRCDESIADVAIALAIPPATARKRLQRTRVRLREALGVVESMLRATRPGPAFTACVVAAFAAGRVVDASAATVSVSSPASPFTKPLAIAAGAAVIVVTIVFVVAARSPAPPTPSSLSPSPSVAAPISTSRASRSPSAAMPYRRITSDARAALIARILQRRATSPSQAKVFDFSDTAVVAGAPLPTTTPIDTLTKGSVRRAIALLHPMLLACHEASSPRGRLAVKLRLAGEGGATIVESVDVTGDPPLSDDADFVECVRTTLESLELPPTHDTVPWDVYFPFVF